MILKVAIIYNKHWHTMLSTIYIYDVLWHVGHIYFTDSSTVCPRGMHTQHTVEFRKLVCAHARRDPTAKRRASQHA